MQLIESIAQLIKLEGFQMRHLTFVAALVGWAIATNAVFFFHQIPEMFFRKILRIGTEEQ